MTRPTAATCSASEVRMKKSVVAPDDAAELAEARGVEVGVLARRPPAAAASCTTFELCSSVPVRKKTSSPRWR